MHARSHLQLYRLALLGAARDLLLLGLHLVGGRVGVGVGVGVGSRVVVRGGIGLLGLNLVRG